MDIDQMISNDKNNLCLAASQEQVDTINSKFYSKYNYPWYPQEFSCPEDPDFWRKFLCQDIGDWSYQRIPVKPKIWVAGCGTNQAVFTALKFPNAEVIGTDISPKSLEICGQIASQLGVKNLRLQQESLNKTFYESEFDYVICTGVIHHNADPSVPLRSLSRALKKNGVLELMVYNYYHRIFTTAFQKAIHAICAGDGVLLNDSQMEREMAITKALIRNFPMENMMKQFLVYLADTEESNIADSLIQPVEHSYTVESLNELVTSGHLELLYHCINEADAGNQRLTWNLDVKEPEYIMADDIVRWQVGNLLMLEKSPMLWFYIQRKDADFTRLSEQALCESFLQTTFTRSNGMRNSFMLDDENKYVRSPAPTAVPLPKVPFHQNAARVLRSLDANKTVGEIMEILNIEKSFTNVNELRVRLTTSAFPYMRAR
jgi:SAM-dependent methyltransferase